MEILLRPIRCYSGGAVIDSRRQCSFSSTDFRLLPSIKPPARRMLSKTACFSDDGHLQYYSSSSRRQRICATESRIRCSDSVEEEEVCQKVGGEEEEENTMTKKKKKNKNKKMNLKMLKALSRDLSTFSDMGFGMDPGSGSPDQQLREGQMISIAEAAELLLGQLQELRAEEMELKKRRNDEKAKLKSLQMENRMDCRADSSSSSSSESSDSNCGSEVVDMRSLKMRNCVPSEPSSELQVINQEGTAALILPSPASSKRIESPLVSLPIISEPMTSGPPESPQFKVSEALVKSDEHKLYRGSTGFSSAGGDNHGKGFAAEKRIEVCMGGKCKKSGAASLLEEFGKVVGEGSVVGCKCMGKCRDGPNVRVLNANKAPTDSLPRRYSAASTGSPLCNGVLLEDVGQIVASFFGQDHNTGNACSSRGGFLSKTDRRLPRCSRLRCHG